MLRAFSWCTTARWGKGMRWGWRADNAYSAVRPSHPVSPQDGETRVGHLTLFSQRYIPMFLRWVLVPLVLQHFQRLDKLLAGLARLDHGIHETAICGDIRVREAVTEFFDFRLTHFVAVGGMFQFTFVDDVHCAFRAHHRDLSGRPGVVHIGTNVF